MADWTRVSSFNIHKSIRQKCPLSPLLYAIAADGLSFLVERRISQGLIKRVSLHSSSQMCFQLFANDTSELVHNNETSLKAFWEYLNDFCFASSSKINQSKTGFKTALKASPSGEKTMIVKCQRME